MTIRRRLNIALLAMLSIILATAAVVVVSVRDTSQQVLAQAQLRELGVMTDDIRAEIFYKVSLRHGFAPIREDDGWWPGGLLDDMAVRVNLSKSSVEREGWSSAREATKRLADIPDGDPLEPQLVFTIDRKLRELRRYYDKQVASAIASTANLSSYSLIVVVGCALISAILVVLVTLLIRDWMVKPLSVLSTAADQIGSGNLQYRIALNGKDELSLLAKRINTMADRLEKHQKQLLENRELTTIGELCSNVAHGLRNPLAGMRASAQMAARRTGDNEKLRMSLDDIVSEADRMDARITRLFELSRIRPLAIHPTLVADLLDDAVAQARGVLQSQRVNVHLTNDGDSTHWPMDHEAMAGVVGELLTNAANHSEEGNVITVSSSSSPEVVGQKPCLTISITDQGCGIPPAELPHVFDLFYTSRTNGTGMGLALARRVVEHHGGTIDIESQPNRGTRVTINLLRR